MSTQWKHLLSLGALFLGGVMLGCTGPPAGDSPRAGDGTTASPVASSEAAARGDGPAAAGSGTAPLAADDSAPTPAVRLQVGGEEELRQLIESHRGKVVLVDFWATWCIPCVQQFPHTVQLSRTRRDQGLAVISVSMDEPSSEAAVRQFLSRQGADFDNLLGKYGAGTQFAEAFEIRGDVPCYKLYDRSGRLRYQFSAEPEGLENGKPISEMDQHVEELLAETDS
ncbi:MAG: redoxin domain-containing protein [Pirellulaceae bacterium]|nr:redoxin domain-containing protein [Pirellulaceae bacterium]